MSCFPTLTVNPALYLRRIWESLLGKNGPKSETKTFPSFFLGVMTPIFGATEVTPKLGATLFRCDTLFGVTHSEQRGKGYCHILGAAHPRF